MATLNERLENATDPLRLIDQFLWSTREEILEAERLYRQYNGHGNNLRNQWLAAQQLSDKREQQAVLALKAGDEGLARMALQEKQQHSKRAQQYRGLYEQSRTNIDDLANHIRELKVEYQTVYDKRDFYQARMESLRLQQHLNDKYMSGMGGNAQGMMRKIDDSLSDMELEARALHDVRYGNDYAAAGAAGYTSDATELFHAANAELDIELAELKKRLEGSDPS
jgi:phage shock protein A